MNSFFKTFDGTKLFYSVEGKGPPLIFCYGLVCSKLHWSYQVEYFKKYYTVIWFDYRGHHNSDFPKSESDLTLGNIAHDLECLMDELNLKEAKLLGHSMGVNIVLELYKRAPHRVKAMILANGSARNPLETAFYSNLMQYLFPALDRIYRIAPKIVNLLWKAQGNSSLSHTLVAWAGFNPTLAKKSDIEQYVRMVSEMDIIVTLQLTKDYANYDSLSWLHTIKAPTLIIAGEKDMLIPREAQEMMHQLIPDSHFETIRNGSHCPQMDIPELVNIIIERFLKENKI